MPRLAATVLVVSILGAGMALLALSQCVPPGRGPGLDRPTEVTVFAHEAAARITLSADSSQATRLVRLLAEASPATAPQGDTTPGYSVVFKSRDAVVATVSFSRGDPVLRVQTGDEVSGAVSPGFAEAVEALVANHR